ncbi:MAG: hypothetical protein WKI04_13325 [Ferruginibacter sp.]
MMKHFLIPFFIDFIIIAGTVDFIKAFTGKDSSGSFLKRFGAI